MQGLSAPVRVAAALAGRLAVLAAGPSVRPTAPLAAARAAAAARARRRRRERAHDLALID